MRPHRRRVRWLFATVLGLACVVPALTVGSAGHAADVPLSIAIDANHFVNGAGQTIRLLGVDEPGTEYACEEGWADSEGANGAEGPADAAAIAGWHANAVRIPLNEDCWLGINGQPSYGTVAEYRQAIESYVADLGADGLYAILDLHWSAPGTLIADGQRPMPDDHSAAFWSSVAAAFAGDPAVVFDAFNEPYSPAASDGGDDTVDWSCWEQGGCTVPDAADGTAPDDSQSYTAVGMQALVDAIRGAGAGQPILLGGLSYANDLSGWLAHEPTDPDDQLAASFHNYQGEACASASCWNQTIAPVAAQVPVVTGEFAEDSASGDFDDTYMDWADAHGVSYLAWEWVVPGPSDPPDPYYLLTAWDGSPASPNGVALEAHLATLSSASPGSGSASSTATAATSTVPATTTAATRTTAPAPAPGTTPPGGQTQPAVQPPAGPNLRNLTAVYRAGALEIALRCSRACSVTVRVRTVARFAVGRRRQQLSLGQARLAQSNRVRRTLTIRVPRRLRTLITPRHALRIDLSLSLGARGARARTLQRAITVR